MDKARGKKIQEMQKKLIIVLRDSGVGMAECMTAVSLVYTKTLAGFAVMSHSKKEDQIEVINQIIDATRKDTIKQIESGDIAEYVNEARRESK